MQNRLLLIILGLLLSDGIAHADSGFKQPEDDSKRATAVALNFCRASFHRIRRYPSTRVLFEEHDKILNNLNLDRIGDQEVIRLYSVVLDEIGHVQLADRERVLLKNKYKQAFRRKLGTHAFLMATQLAIAQVGPALRTGAASWWDYRESGWNRDLDLWRIDKQQITAVVAKSSQFLDTFWKLAQKKKIPDRWLVRGNDLDKLEEALRQSDPVVRLRILKRMEGFLEFYPPYWYHVARTQQSIGQLFAAVKTYDKLAEIGSGHFRKDEMLAAGLANQAAIQDSLQQQVAVQTAQKALEYSTDAWEPNLMAARVLARHGKNELAEDAILRNLDVDLERELSLSQLLLLYANTDHQKLVQQLNNPSVVRDVPVMILVTCAQHLEREMIPAELVKQLSESLYGYPNLHFGRDDFVIVARPNWRLDNATVKLTLGRHEYVQPKSLQAKGHTQLRFQKVHDVGTPFDLTSSDLQKATMSIEYPGLPTMTVTLRRNVQSKVARVSRSELRLVELEMDRFRVGLTESGSSKPPVTSQPVGSPSKPSAIAPPTQDSTSLQERGAREWSVAPPPPPPAKSLDAKRLLPRKTPQIN